jgi:hypothetical protein
LALMSEMTNQQAMLNVVLCLCLHKVSAALLLYCITCRGCGVPAVVPYTTLSCIPFC